MSTVAGLELSVLLAVARLGDEAYGLAVRRDVGERMERDYSVGAIYTTLERLQEKGLINSRQAPPTPTRGGRSRRQFRLTAKGEKAIREARDRVASQWTGILQPLKAELG
jgi:DNA-binding PadR family transcriptional regulator